MQKTCKVKTKTNFYITEDGKKELFRESSSEIKAEIEFIKYFNNKIAVQIEMISKNTINITVDENTKIFFDIFDKPGKNLKFIVNDKNELENCINLEEIINKWDNLKREIEINDSIEEFVFKMDKMYKNKKILNDTVRELYFLPYYFKDYTEDNNIICIAAYK